MAMHTGENEQGLKKVIDMTRFISIVILLIHCYYNCYGTFKTWGLTSKLSDRLLGNILRTALLSSFHKPKLIALGFLLISVMGIKGRKSEKINYRSATAYLLTGLMLYFISALVIYLPGLPVTAITVTYMTITGIGFILVLTGAGLFTRIIKDKMKTDVFNTLNETFPQEERLITNEYSINLPARYNLKGKTRESWINFINPRRGLLIMGSPGSGKSYFIIDNIIRQLMEKGFALMIYDFKFPDLTLMAYNRFLQCTHLYKVKPSFHAVNFTNPEQSARSNPLYPELLTDIMDAMEASKTMLLSINRTWAAKQGEFFVESPINFLAAVFWFLKKYKHGKYCTLPHAIELVQLDYNKLFTLLNTEEEIQILVTPFISAYLNDIMETVESQIASVRIPLGRLSSPQLYYILSGNDFSFDINNPAAPKIICLGNDPLKSEALAPVISLFCDRLNKIINQKGKAKCATIYDEFGTIRVSSIQTIIATGRSNDIIPVIAVQDYSQLKKVYSKEEAEAILNMTGNIISGQVSGETAKLLSERFPRIMQDRESLSINSADTSISKSKQLDSAIPASTIASLSSGEFVGMVADNPNEIIDLKIFHSKIVNDHNKLKKEKNTYLPLPPASSSMLVDKKTVIQSNYQQVKQDIQDIFETVMEELLNDPTREYLIIKK